MPLSGQADLLMERQSGLLISCTMRQEQVLNMSSADWNAWGWPGECLLHEARNSADRDLPLPIWGRAPEELLLAPQPCGNADLCVSGLRHG